MTGLKSTQVEHQALTGEKEVHSMSQEDTMWHLLLQITHKSPGFSALVEALESLQVLKKPELPRNKPRLT